MDIDAALQNNVSTCIVYERPEGFYENKMLGSICKECDHKRRIDIDKKLCADSHYPSISIYCREYHNSDQTKYNSLDKFDRQKELLGCNKCSQKEDLQSVEGTVAYCHYHSSTIDTIKDCLYGKGVLYTQCKRLIEVNAWQHKEYFCKKTKERIHSPRRYRECDIYRRKNNEN